jgi:hypothetical protein
MVGFNGKKLIYLQPKSVYECNLNKYSVRSTPYGVLRTTYVTEDAFWLFVPGKGKWPATKR